jgi:selenophosphate synthase
VPFSALAIATLPYARGPVQEAQLFELLSGALHTFKQVGVVLTGGHTTEGPELALGFAVTGHADAAPPTRAMNSRRFTQSPRRRERAERAARRYRGSSPFVD